MSNYSGSKLVNQLHELPHYDFSFKRVSNEFDISNTKYQESLMQFAAPWVVLALICVIGLTLIRRAKPNFSEYAPLHDEPGPVKKWFKCLLFSCVIIVVCSPIQYYGNEEITVGVERFANRLRGTQTSYDKVMETARNTNASVDDAIVSVDSIEWPDDGTRAELVEQLGAVNTALDTILGYSDAIAVAQYADDVEKYNKMRWEAMMGFAALLLLAAALTYLGRKSNGSWLCFIETFIGALGLIVTGVYLALAVGVADFCSGPNEVLSQVLPSEGLVGDAVEYYINCPSDATSPFLGDIDDVLVPLILNQSIAQLNSTIYNIQEQGRQGLNVTELVEDLQEVNASAATMIEASECKSMHAEYVGAVEAVCGPTLEGFMVVLIAVAVSSVCIMIASLAQIRLAQHHLLSSSPLKPPPTGGSPQRPYGRKYRGRGKPPSEYDPLVHETYFGRA